MQGKVGEILADGKPVGGFLLWKLGSTVQVATASNIAVKWHCTLNAYWLSKRVSECTLRFHSDVENAYWDAQAHWQTHPPALGVLVEGELTLVGAGQLKAGKYGTE